MNYLMVVQPIEQYQNKEKFCMPLGIAYVNGALRAAGFSVFGINMMFVKEDPWTALEKEIREHQIDVLLCGGLTSEYKILKKVYDTARTANPDIILIGGGGGFTSEPIIFSELTGVDYAVIGEGELTNPELARALEEGSDPAQIPGIVYRKEGKYLQTSPRPVIEDIDSLPFPSYEGLAMEEYLSLQQIDGWYNYFTYYSDTPRLMPMMMSRSCPYHCSFCFHPIGQGYRARSLDNFFQELDMWVDKYRINGISLVDECFSINAETVQEFCKRIKPYHLAWACQMRAEVYNADMIRAMKDSGCIGACFGIESMSQIVLDNMQKHLKRETIENALRLSYKYQVGTSGNLIFGAETETFDTVYDSITWDREHMDQNHRQPINTFTYIQTYPGSRYYENACKNGRIPDRKSYIAKGQWVLNITEMSDRDYWTVGEAARLLQHETRDQGEVLDWKMQEDGRFEMTFRCGSCGSVHTYRNLSRRHLKEGRVRSLGCRTCNSLGDYLLQPENYPYERYVTVDWLLNHYDPGDVEDYLWERGVQNVILAGAGYAAEKLVSVLQKKDRIRVCCIIKRKKNKVFDSEIPFVEELPEAADCDLIIDTEMVHFLWRRAEVDNRTEIEVVELEEILRKTKEKEQGRYVDSGR